MSYYYTLPDGRQMTQAEWDAHTKKRIEAEILAEWQAQNEAARLVAELSEAYNYPDFKSNYLESQDS